MLIVGELINTSRAYIKDAVENKDADTIIMVAKAQEEAGANYLDINCGTFFSEEPNAMEWLVKTIRSYSQIPLCIDSPNIEALKIGLEMCGPNAMINSTTFESERFEAVVPLAIQYKTKLISLCIDDNGMPDTAEDRILMADKMIEQLNDAGMKNNDIYIDPLVKPISAGIDNGASVLNAIPVIMRKNPGVHMICGLTNISFNLPARVNVNKTFMIQTMTMGMDAYIIDITNKEIAGGLYASRLLLGQDKYCRNYIKAYRNGIYS